MSHIGAHHSVTAADDGAGADTLTARAAEALRLATVDPQRAQTLCKRLEQQALTAGNWAATSVTRRASGVAAMQLRDLDGAIVALRSALKAAALAGDPQLRGQAHMSLAAALAIRGSPKRAYDEIDAALAQLSGLDAARARTQRAAILQDLGRSDEALDDLRLALPVLRRSGDAQWETRALSNRSLIYSARRSFAAAEADLLRAGQLCTAHGLTLALAYVEQNLGCMYTGRGDVPVALEHFDRAATLYRGLGMDVGSLLMDRATMLLSVRLIAEARDNAEAAVAVFTRQSRELNVPEAQLLLSTTSLLQDDVATATAAAEAAARDFGRTGRAEWLALARYALLQAELATARLADRDQAPGPGTVRAVPYKRAVACAAELERTGWDVPALEARVLAGRLALAQGRLDVARQELGSAARARRSGPADARARAWLAEALLREAEGHRRGALVALRTGLRVVEDYRATMGAADLRAYVSGHRGELARAGLRMALHAHDARATHDWAERGRASATLLQPVRPPDDPGLAHDLQDFRATTMEIDVARQTGLATVEMVARQVALENRIRDHCRRSPGCVGPTTAKAPSVAELAEALGETALVEYVEHDGALHAVTIIDGRVRLHALGNAGPLRHSLVHLPFALHRLAQRRTPAAQRLAATQVLDHVTATLDCALLTPLARHVGDRPLLLVPAGWLQSLPWSALPSCAGRSLSVTPSAALWYRAQGRVPQPSGAVSVVAGPGLPGALQEATTVAALHPNAQILHGPAATAQAVAAAMDGAHLVHIAAHGVVRADNPLFSSLLLADGPFTVHDFERLEHTPHHVVLAACDTARAHVVSGGEILGLAATLLSQHTATLIAPVVTIPDAETAELMASYHRNMLSGSPPAAALAQAQQQHRADSLEARATCASFLCLGAGHRAPGFGGPPVPGTWL